MTDTDQRPPLPDHLSVDPSNPHYVDAVFEQGFIKKIGGKKEQRKTGPVRRGDGDANLSDNFDRGRMRN